MNACFVWCVGVRRFAMLFEQHEQEQREEGRKCVHNILRSLKFAVGGGGGDVVKRASPPTHTRTKNHLRTVRQFWPALLKLTYRACLRVLYAIFHTHSHTKHMTLLFHSLSLSLFSSLDARDVHFRICHAGKPIHIVGTFCVDLPPPPTCPTAQHYPTPEIPVVRDVMWTSRAIVSSPVFVDHPSVHLSVRS